MSSRLRGRSGCAAGSERVNESTFSRNLTPTPPSPIQGEGVTPWPAVIFSLPPCGGGPGWGVDRGNSEIHSHLLTRPVGRPPKKPIVSYASLHYQAAGWTRARRVVAKVEWHQGELYPRVGFIVTNLIRPNKRVVKFYNGRGTAEQWIKEGKNALRWTRLSCHAFRHNAVRLQLHALAYNLANFLRTMALPQEVEHWSLTTLRDKLVKIGARIVRHGRYVVFQLAEVAVPRALFADILRRIDGLRPQPPPLPA